MPDLICSVLEPNGGNFNRAPFGDKVRVMRLSNQGFDGTLIRIGPFLGPANGEIRMTFAESIKTCFSKYADFNGRASRPEFWWWVLFVFLASAAASIVSPVVSGLFSLGVLLPNIAVAARRLHDTDRSGWFQLVALIPLIGWILMIYWCVQEGKDPNRFGPPRIAEAPAS